MLKLQGSFSESIWVCIEGVDAVGKTTMVKNIRRFLVKYKQNKYKIVILEEFSKSKVGHFIRNIIIKDKFFTLGNRKVQFPISETLLLCADFIYQVERLSKYKNKRLLIISDRGPLTFFTYQMLRIKGGHRNFAKKNIATWLTEIFGPIESPTVTFLLTLPINVIQNRLSIRDGHVPRKNISFIKKAQEEYLREIAHYPRESYLILENIDSEIKKNENIILDKILKLIK